MTVDLSSVFGTSVQSAVGSSVGQNKPLVVYIASSEDATWINRLMDEETLGLISESAVGLQLTKGSAECQLFEQVFPNAQAPSVFIVRVQHVLDVIHGEVSQDEFKTRVRRAVESEPTPLPAQSPTPTPVPGQQQQQQHQPQHQQQEPAQQPSPTAASARSPTPSQPHAARATPRQQPQHEQPRKTLKEQSAELAAKRYRDEQLRIKQTKREERERIRRLLKADEDERKALERMRRASKPHDEVNDEEGDAAIKELRDNIKNKSRDDTCALSLRLLDGHSVQHVFKSKDRLKDVRLWLYDNRTDGNGGFLFHRTIPRVTYATDEEEKTLEELELTPRSALILQPNQMETYNTASEGGILYRVLGGLTSFWGRGNNPAQGHDVVPSASSTHEPFRDVDDGARSPQSSHYASPMHSPYPHQPEPHTPQLSLNPSQLNLNLNVLDSDEPIQGPIPDIPIQPPASLSRMSSNIRTLDETREDDQDRFTYNGNRVNLEDDKKKDSK